MLGLDSRVLRAVWTAFVFALIVVLIYLTRHILVIFTLAIFLAHLLAPLVDRLDRQTSRRISRNFSLTIVYLALIGIALAILIPIGAKVGEQASALAGRLPEVLKNDPLSRLPLPGWLEAWRPQLTDFVVQRTSGFDATILPVLKEIGPGIVSGLGNLVAVVLIPILSFFFLKDGREMRGAILEGVQPGRRIVVEEILDDLHVLVAQYIRALVLLAIATFASYSLFFGITGVPYPVLLASIAGVLELIPVVGPLTAAVTTLVVAGLSGYDHMLWIIIFLIVWRLFQDYVLSPYLLSSGVAIHPLLVLFGVLAGEQVAGVPGMFFSVPVIAALRIIVVRMRRNKVHA